MDILYNITMQLGIIQTIEKFRAAGTYRRAIPAHFVTISLSHRRFLHASAYRLIRHLLAIDVALLLTTTFSRWQRYVYELLISHTLTGVY